MARDALRKGFASTMVLDGGRSLEAIRAAGGTLE